jgi:hypothetical protein
VLEIGRLSLNRTVGRLSPHGRVTVHLCSPGPRVDCSQRPYSWEDNMTRPTFFLAIAAMGLRLVGALASWAAALV